MWGGSYLGFVQWATLKESPPYLRTIVPVASSHPLAAQRRGMLNTWLVQSLILTSGGDAAESLMLRGAGISTKTSTGARTHS
jgi:hypothetical protein